MPCKYFAIFRGVLVPFKKRLTQTGTSRTSESQFPNCKIKKIPIHKVVVKTLDLVPIRHSKAFLSALSLLLSVITYMVF